MRPSNSCSLGNYCKEDAGPAIANDEVNGSMPLSINEIEIAEAILSSEPIGQKKRKAC